METSSVITNSIVLSQVDVRPICSLEKEEWVRRMCNSHYLGFNGPIGESIQYVAICKGEWVALLGWSAASWHIDARDKWIGWDDKIRRTRLNLVANNTRFLILPEVNIKNLASRVLSLNTARLSNDWQKAYGHPILLAETFVDPRFKGTCYRAAGWVHVGKTRGFRRIQGGFYASHGAPKLIFLRELSKNTRKELSNPYVRVCRQSIDSFIMNVWTLPFDGKDGLIDTLRKMPDPRCRMGKRHSFVSVLALTTCAMLSGARTLKSIGRWIKNLSDEQLQHFRCRMQRRPAQSTIERVLHRCDAIAFDATINNWLSTVRHGVGTAVLRHDFKKFPVKFLTFLLSEDRHDLLIRKKKANFAATERAVPCQPIQ